MKFLQLQKNVVVASTNSQQTIELPTSVTLFPPLEVTGSSVQLSWSRSQLRNFLEYKLYTHSISGLDEDTGVLVNVATHVDDTVFTDGGFDR